MGSWMNEEVSGREVEGKVGGQVGVGRGGQMGREGFVMRQKLSGR